MSNYRPVSHLSYLSKLIEKVIASQIVKHLDKNSMMEKFQSAYRQSHRTETALLHVFNDFTVNFDHDKGTLLALLYLSPALTLSVAQGLADSPNFLSSKNPRTF